VIPQAIPQTTEEAVRLIGMAGSPYDLFPADHGEAVKLHRVLARLTHPDTHPDQAGDFARLSDLWAGYGHPGPDVIHGDIADLFEQEPGLLAKYPLRDKDNDLMAAEASALRKLRDSTYPDFFPELVSSVRQKDPATGVMRRVNTLRVLGGFYDLAAVAREYPAGLHPRDAAWMWRRILWAVATAHDAGLVHGAVLPEHVMVHPQQHGLALADWCYSVPAGGKVAVIVERYRDWYPPEITGREPVTAATDIFMTARLMLHMMGPGAPVQQLRSFAKGCMFTSQQKRPQNAWALLNEFDDLLERLFGPPEFHEFTMPETGKQ
jgi:hypothetical protein